MSKFPKFPEGIAAPFPAAARLPQDVDDATLTPEQFVHRPQVAQKGRGAVTNLRGRYDSVRRESFDDGWQAPQMGVEHEGADREDEQEHDDDQPPPLKTIVTEETARSIISRNISPDLPFSLSINPYRVITPVF